MNHIEWIIKNINLMARCINGLKSKLTAIIGA